MYYGQSIYRNNRNNRNNGSSTSKRRISVIGEGELQIQPTEAQIQIGVTIENKKLNEAQAESTSKITNIVKGLNELGIPDELIQTAVYQVFPVYDYNEGTQVLRGYQVEHLLRVTVRDLEKTGMIVDTAVQNGANTVSSIRFTISSPNVYQKQALSYAVNNAVEKAEVIARSMGVHLDRTPLRVTEQKVINGSAPVFSASLMSKAESVPIHPGELTIRSSVAAEFSFM